ncbi:MAG: hypothetical protein ACXIUD_01705 [Mongoliitalea sp.]
MSWGLKHRVVLLFASILLGVLALLNQSWMTAVAMSLVMTSLILQVAHERKIEKESKNRQED